MGPESISKASYPQLNTSTPKENQIERKLTRLKQTIGQQGKLSPRFYTLLNEAETLRDRGNLGLAERKLKEAEKIVEDENINGNFLPGIEVTYGVTRTYKDSSDDVGATFQHPTPMNELEAPVRVAGHERGHVIRAVAKALVNRREIEHAYFVMKWRVDWEHHKFYTVGGEARMKIGGQRLDLKV